jgi:hypothetical protein
MMSKDELVDELEEGERVETDMSYKASAPEYVNCPGTIWNDKEKTKHSPNKRFRSSKTL